MSQESGKETKTDLTNEKGHLTSDVPIRYRGHASEMIPRHGELQTTMQGKDVHYKEKQEEVNQNKQDIKK
jgi:hypothetical protein